MKNIKIHFGGGFTLIELIVVLLLISLALGMVAPRVSVGMKKLTRKNFVMTTIKLLNRARFRAISSGRESTFFINAHARSMGIDNTKEEKIPENVDIYSNGLEQLSRDLFVIRFFPDGSTTTTSIEITFDKKDQYFISINPFSGEIAFRSNQKS